MVDIMKNNFVRIENITIENFKNVQYGTLDLENKRKNYKASIIGLYGQNGSGKTALIDAFQILKYCLCGNAIPSKYADYINIEAEFAKLTFKFKICDEADIYDIQYELVLKRVKDELISNDDTIKNSEIKYKVQVSDEVLSYGFISDKEKLRRSILINTKDTFTFLPKAKYNELLGENKTDIMNVIITKRLTQEQSRTFIFSREMLNMFRENCKNNRHLFIIDSLFKFGNNELFVINTENSGLISMNAMSLSFKYKNKNKEALGTIAFPLDAPVYIPEREVTVLKKITENMNIVLNRLVPGLTIGIVDLGTQVSKEGEVGKLIQLMSLKNKKAIPFVYESEGIKKIVSVLQLLIVVYNNPSITVAIDELDAGIFEYLLGEVLNIISEKGKGQLIFTSHNLRPLETIDRGFIAFTTTNPKKRYIRMTNVKGNNNLRDFYYRDIVLGEQLEQLYNPTDNLEISLAFRKAGESFGK